MLFQKFLLLEEVEPTSSVEHVDLRPVEDESLLQLDKVTAKWEGVGMEVCEAERWQIKNLQSMWKKDLPVEGNVHF